LKHKQGIVIYIKSALRQPGAAAGCRVAQLAAEGQAQEQTMERSGAELGRTTGPKVAVLVVVAPCTAAQARAGALHLGWD
jgi:hypothetical protein